MILYLELIYHLISVPDLLKLTDIRRFGLTLAKNIDKDFIPETQLVKTHIEGNIRHYITNSETNMSCPHLKTIEYTTIKNHFEIRKINLKT